jgi:hypothetical protein
MFTCEIFASGPTMALLWEVLLLYRPETATPDKMRKRQEFCGGKIGEDVKWGVVGAPSDKPIAMSAGLASRKEHLGLASSPLDNRGLGLQHDTADGRCLLF